MSLKNNDALHPKTVNASYSYYFFRYCRTTQEHVFERDGKRYAYRLTGKGTKVALLFVFFHKQLCGPLANSLFHHQPDTHSRPKSKLEIAYHKADASIRNIIELLEAA